MLLLACVTLCLSASPRAVRAEVFASFESESDLAAWKAGEGATAAQSTQFAAWYDRSLEVHLPADGRGGLGTSVVPGDWGLSEALCFFCYSPLPTQIALTLRDSSGRHAERIVDLKRGSNHVQIRLGELVGLNLRAMAGLAISTPRGIPSASLYLDQFALETYNDILAARGRMDGDYTRSEPTPHVPWATPLAGGAIRALFVPDVMNGRCVAEISQRLELDCRAVTLGASFATNIWGFGDFYGARGRTLNESPTSVYSLAYTYIEDDLINGPPYDVIVIPGSQPWSEWPEAARGEIERRVSEGAGLVMVYPYFQPGADNGNLPQLSPLLDVEKTVTVNDNNFQVDDPEHIHRSEWRRTAPHYITRNVPLEAFPFDQMHYSRSKAAGQVLLESAGDSAWPILAVKDYGKGRVVAMSYGQRGLIPRINSIWQVDKDYPYWEYMYSLVARSMVWAAHRESECAITGITLGGDGAATVEVQGPPTVKSRTLEIVFRDAFGQVIDTSRVAVPKSGSGSLKARLPKDAPGGTLLADCRLLEDGQVLDWGSAVGHLPARASIARIQYSADRFQPGQPVTGKVILQGKPAAGATLGLELRDNEGRLLDRKSFDLAAGQAEAEFSLNADNSLAHLIWVDCALMDSGRRLDRKRASAFFQRGSAWEDYDVVMYLFGPDPMPGLWPTIERKLKEFYTTTLSSYPLELSKYANFHVQAQTRISGQESPDGPARNYYNHMKEQYVTGGDKHVLIREACLNDPAYLEREKKELTALTAPWVPFSPRSYYIYEEPSLTCYGDAVDICFSPFCMAAMREWLKGRYGNLDSLNSVWGTKFASWDTVEPDDSREAQVRGNYASWADHRWFMERTYAGNYEYVKQTLRGIDPTGIVLSSGTQIVGSHNGCDYWKLDRILGHLNPYGGENQMDFHRAFGLARGLKLSAGMGYGVRAPAVMHNLYANLFNGCWAGCYVFWQYSVLDPGLNFCQSSLDMQKGLAEVAGGGIARLFKNLKSGNDGIAIHYSMASTHGTWISDGKVQQQVGYHTSAAFDRYQANRQGWTDLLTDLGYQYEFLAGEEIEAGQLEKGGYKVMILPMSVALSPGEAAAIQSFVAAGGTVIADRFPGVMDDLNRWRKKGMLDEVFGITRLKAPGPGDFTLSGPALDINPAGATAAATLEGAPVGLSHAFSGGQAYHLGYLIDDYPELVRDGRAGQTRKLVGDVLAQAGAAPAVRLADPRGEPVSGVTGVSFVDGKCTLVGLVRGESGASGGIETILKLPAAAHIYDVRRGAYLGRADRLAHTLAPDEPAVFALLPAELAAPAVSAAATVRAGGSLEYSVSVPGAPEMHDVAVVEVLDPAGLRRPLYSTRIDLDSGRGSGTLPLALDDPAGRWRIRVRDVVSGLTAETFFDLEK